MACELATLPHGMLEMPRHARFTFIRPIGVGALTDFYARLFLDVALLGCWKALSDTASTLDEQIEIATEILITMHRNTAYLHDRFLCFTAFRSMWCQLARGRVLIQKLGKRDGLRYPMGMPRLEIMEMATLFDSAESRKKFFFGSRLCGAHERMDYDDDDIVNRIFEAPALIDITIQMRLKDGVYAFLEDYYKAYDYASSDSSDRCVDLSEVMESVPMVQLMLNIPTCAYWPPEVELPLDMSSLVAGIEAWQVKRMILEMAIRSICTVINHTLTSQALTRFRVSDLTPVIQKALHRQQLIPMIEWDGMRSLGYWHPIEGLKVAYGTEDVAALSELYLSELKIGDPSCIDFYDVVGMLVPEKRIALLKKAEIRRELRDIGPLLHASFCAEKHRHREFAPDKVLEWQYARRLYQESGLGLVPDQKRRNIISDMVSAVVRLQDEDVADQKRRKIISDMVSAAVFDMPCMRLPREGRLALQAAVKRARDANHERRSKFAMLSYYVKQQLVSDEQARQQLELERWESLKRARGAEYDALIARLRELNAVVRNGVADRMNTARENCRWHKAEKARQKADCLATQQRKAEDDERTARNLTERLRKARWIAEREAKRAHSKAVNNSAPKLSARNLGKITSLAGNTTSTDDDSSSVAASQAVSMAPSIKYPHVASQLVLPRMTQHAANRNDSRKPCYITPAEFQRRKHDCLSKPDRKWIVYDHDSGEPTTVVQRGTLKLYLDRHGTVIRTVVWKQGYDSDSSTSEARPGPSSAPSTPPTTRMDDWVEQRHMEEAIRRSLE